jgi:Uma2 family endonuclease
MPRLPETAYFTTAPDWVCEVLSPSTATLDRAKKLRYAREQVAHCWLVDPIARMIEILRLESSHWVILATHAEGETIRVEPFDAVDVELSLLWEDEPTA